ncbi:MAG: C1 family peptidase [Saonia sp.]
MNFKQLLSIVQYSASLVLLLIFFQSCVLTKKFSQTVFVPSTPLKHQKFTGQCWSFTSTSLLEAEALRLGYNIPELSSFFFVYHNYLENATDYLDNQGRSHLNNGDLTFSVLEIFNTYGAVPESIYDGNLGSIKSKKEMRNRMSSENEMNDLIRTKLDSIIKNGEVNRQYSINIIRDVLEDYIGQAPKEFTYNNESYTAKGYAEKFLPLNASDYIELTSYNHLPFGQRVILEIPANWRDKGYLNLPLEQFIETIDKAIKGGFSLAWDGDIGPDGGFKDNGYVTLKGEYETLPTITQKERQSAFDRKTTQDEHNMHLVGITYDSSGEKFYILKNTWGSNWGADGLWYLSENYFRLRTISVTVHRDGIYGSKISTN